MPSKSLKFCNHPGCRGLTTESYCEEHKAEGEAKKQEAFSRYDKRRGNAQDRGYNGLWQKRSKRYLSRPENQICKLHLDDRCAVVAQCVDHIIPHNGPDDPLFWDESNWQASCIRCNSVKGRRTMKGTYDIGAG